jgi:hypothetical protein
VGPDLLTAVTCPACSAALRPGAPWCTLCYADLRPPEPQPEVQSEPEPETQQQPSPIDVVLTGTGWPGAQPAGQPTAWSSAPPPVAQQATGWPCATCDAVNDLDLATCEGCGAPFLAALVADAPALVLPGVGDVTRLSPPQRYALVGAVVLVIALLTALLGLL